MEVEQFECDLCKMTFSVERLYREHLKDHEPEYMCKVCKKMFFSEKAVTKHDCHGGKYGPFECDKCGKEFDSKAGLGQHLRRHRPFQCKINGCSKRFEKKTAFKRHLKIHEPKKKTQACMVCLKEFFDFNDLVKHMKMHSGSGEKDSEPVKKPHSSEPTKAILHKKSNELYTCIICQEKFSSPSQLSEHMIMHSGSGEKDSEPVKVKKPIPCNTCQEKFSNAHLLKLHLQVFHKEKTLPCDVCGKSFLFQNNLTRHQLVHSGELYKCATCHKIFESEKALSKHTRIHTKESFTCTVCKRIFKQKSHLISHLRSHPESRVLVM